MLLEEDEHIFQKFTDRSRGTLTSPCQIHGVLPNKRKRKDDVFFLSYQPP